MEFASFDNIFQRDKLHSVEIARVEDAKKGSGSTSGDPDGGKQADTQRQTRMGMPSVSSPDPVLEQELNRTIFEDGHFFGDATSTIDKVSLKAYEKYARQAADPFSLFSEDGGDEMKEKEQAYVSHLRDMLIHEDDAWGMKRLQAHAGNTLLLLKGPFKGLPRSLAVTSALYQQNLPETDQT